MRPTETSEIMRRFNQAFAEHEPSLLPELIAPDCVMESIQPAPDGTRYEGYEACLSFWQALASDRVAYFDVEDTVVMGDRAVIRWRFNFGDGGSVRGVNLMHVRDGRIVEALGYSKFPGQSAPLPGVENLATVASKETRS
jgi:ketosteroid isomerase-like protein